jgi:hypothetical protein
MSGMGFRLARSQGMEGSTGNLNEFPIAPGNTNKIFRGDLVTLNGGKVEVTDGAAGEKVLGIFWGCKYVAADGSFEFRPMWDGVPGRKDILAHVAVMPAGSTMLVRGQPGAAYTDADVGTRKAADVTAVGDPLSGMSRATLGAPGATVPTAALVVLRKVDIPASPAVEGDWFEVTLAADSAITNVGA